MPVPTVIGDLSVVASSNSPAGTDAPSALDDHLRAHAGFIAYLRDFKQFSMESTVASAATTDIGAAASYAVRITGTTTITSFGIDYQGPRFIRFAGALTLTNSSSLVLPGGANITTAAGDTCIAVPFSSGWVVSQYQRASLPAFSAYRSSSQTIGSTLTTVAFNAEDYDTTSSHSNGVFTAPVAGVYLFSAGVGNSTTPCAMNQRFVKNEGGTPAYFTGNYAVGTVNNVSMTAQIKLAVGDTVSYQVSQSTSQSINTGQNNSFFQGTLLRPF